MRRKFFIFIICLLFLLAPFAVFAVKVIDFSRMERKTDITVTGIITPKVVIFETGEDITTPVLLLDESTGMLLPVRIERASSLSKTVAAQVILTSSLLQGATRALVDDDPKTTFAFNPDQEGAKQLVVQFDAPTPITGLETHLDTDVIRPSYISARAKINDNEFTTIINRALYSGIIAFPKVAATALEISYETPHFLRIQDLEFLGEPKTTTSSRVIFFGEEGKQYSLYWDAHFGQETYTPTVQQPLGTDKKTPVFPLPPSALNPVFNPDWDGDGIRDETDLCPKEYDSANTDSDKNGRGDVCEDPDQDGSASSKDNCPFAYNPTQEDADQDGIGDLCDAEENRFTEIYDDIVLWGAFGAAALLLAFLVVRAMRRKEQ